MFNNTNINTKLEFSKYGTRFLWFKKFEETARKRCDVITWKRVELYTARWRLSICFGKSAVKDKSERQAYVFVLIYK